MVKVSPYEHLFSLKAKKILGKNFLYGIRKYGRSLYGGASLVLGEAQYGIRAYGGTKYGNAFERFGIYQVRTRYGPPFVVREKFYEPSDQTQPNKVARQNIFAAAVTGWQALTDQQKAVYNKNAIGKGMSGYNLFLREYLLSH